jgi:hypothetical protein
MKTAFILCLVMALPLAAVAATPMPVAAQVAEPVAEAEVPEYGPFATQDRALPDLLWVARPIVVFADTPNDPNFDRQVQMLLERPAALAERDIVILTDTDPGTLSDARKQLRPRGFSLVIMDRDGEVKLRKPSPWSLREVLAAIDKFPSRRQDMLEQRPSGR